MLHTLQYLDEAEQLVDDPAVIDRGQVIAAGAPDGLKATIGERLAVVAESTDAPEPAVSGLNALPGTNLTNTEADRLVDSPASCANPTAAESLRRSECVLNPARCSLPVVTATGPTELT
ncbi:hypothetical protein ABZX12_38250 [Kribbella sp. NPDC003505]|uniref:hypothetical protein n=1 Tax=Kribbella sp. NPDC003505 TaxID=3154448 RepID=UPI0033A89153